MEENQTGVEVAGEAALQTGETQETEVQTGAETQSEAGTKPTESDTETAWAKRISAIKTKTEQEVRERLEKEYTEKFKGYEDYKYLAEYLQQANNGADLLSIKEQIELERLQQRAEQANVPPEVLKRIDELEAKAAKAEEYEKQQAQQTELQKFRSSLETFAKEKGANADELHQFMYENSIANPELAYKAMRAEQLEKDLAAAKENAVKEYLESKKTPRVEGNGTPGIVHEDPSKMGWGDIRQRALARIQATSQQQ